MVNYILSHLFRIMCNCLQQIGSEWEAYLKESIPRIPWYEYGNIRSAIFSRFFIRPLDYEVCYCKPIRGIGITISPDPSKLDSQTKNLTFISKVHKCFTKSFIRDYYYSFEATQKGNIHVHGFIATTSKGPGNVKYEFRRSLESYLGYKDSILCKWSDKEHTINYITKNDPKDLILRKKYNLEDLYTNQKNG